GEPGARNRPLRGGSAPRYEKGKMINAVIIVLVLVGSALHRYLSAYWEQGILPYSSGFLLFANLFALTYLIGFIWMFGAVPGIAITLLCYFQVVHSAGLWVFGLPWLIRMNKGLAFPTVNRTAYGSFSLVVIAVVILTALNFFISPYKSMWESIGDHRWTVVLAFLGILIIGNAGRVVIMSKVLKS
ncbi:MAG: hypothetical protein QME44_04785, partial [Thermodesulfobacteriota bacterium]|nr:hypothetical protein [Thermodesulfobacteriota bacterium]